MSPLVFLISNPNGDDRDKREMFLRSWWWRWRLATGKEIARLEGEKKDGRIEMRGDFEITTRREWCRIGVICRFSETVKWYRYSPSLEIQFNPYRLSITDSHGNCIFSEERSFMEFISLFKTAYFGRRYLGKYTAIHRCIDMPILDFIPPAPGRYELRFCLIGDEVFSEVGRKRMTSFQRLTLYVREGVKPVEGLPHSRVDLTSD